MTVQEKFLSAVCEEDQSRPPMAFQFYAVSDVAEKTLKQNFSLSKGRVPEGSCVLVDPSVAGALPFFLDQTKSG